MEKLKKRFLLILFMLPVSLIAQKKQGRPLVDSLLMQLPKAISDTNKVKILNNLSFSYSTISPDTAIQYAKSALALSKKLGWKKGTGKSYQNLGVISRYTTQYPLALEYYDKARKEFEAENDDASLAILNNNVGIIYFLMGNFDKSVNYCVMSLKFNHAIENLNGLGSSYGLLANIYATKGDYAKAKVYYYKALKYRQQPGDKSKMALTFGSLAELYLNEGKFDSANLINNKALELYDGLGDKNGIASSKILLGSVLIKQGHLAQAEKILKNALKLVEEIKDHEIEQNGLKALAQLYRMEGKHDEAYLVNEKYHAVKDSIFSSENGLKIGRLEAQHQIDKEHLADSLETSEKEKTISLQESELGRQQAVIAGIAAVALLLTLSVIFALVNYRKIRRLNSTLDKQKYELTQINEVKDKLFAIISHDLRSPLSSMDSMLKLLKRGNLDESSIEKHADKLSGVLQQNVQLLDNLLQWAATQMRGMEVNKTEVNITALIEENILLVQNILDNKRITLTEMTGKELKVVADISMIRLVLRNLLSNAVKYTPEGGNISLKATVKEDRVWVAVTDTGTGMDSALRDAIQNGRLKESTPGTKLEKGFGIGLMLCLEFIEKNGGKLIIDSTPGVGSTFSFNLPLAA